MPIVTINLLEGRTQNQKRDLIRNVTNTISETISSPMESIRVIINEMPFENYGVAGLPVKEYRITRKSK